jgi:NTP pyrophosphatase (non-canonical NTP hydrolase)
MSILEMLFGSRSDDYYQPIDRSLTFDQLRNANIERGKTYKDVCGDVIIDTWEANDWMTALCGEVGELANMLKKYKRDYTPDDDCTEFLADISKEMADVQVYLDLLAEHFCIDLGEATRNKFNEVSDRIGCDVKL